MKIQNGETHHYIASLNHEADKKKNGARVGTLGVFFGLIVGVLAYLFVSGLLGRCQTCVMRLCVKYRTWTICECGG